MRLIEGRRLTGPNLFQDLPGVAVEIAIEAGEDAQDIARRFGQRVLHLAHKIGVLADLQEADFVVRAHKGGLTLVFPARIDALEAAVELAEWAIGEDSAEHSGVALKALFVAESNPQLLALQQEASARNTAFLWDEDGATLGQGCFSQTWPLRDLPVLHTIDWQKYRRIPQILVTGTNGKTTTARLLARLAQTLRLTVANTSTDGLYVQGKLVEAGDWTGPGGARKILRDERVEAAILEVARGGLLRRGLATTGADAAIVTNVSDDHLGEWGIDSIGDMAEAKLVIHKGLRPDGWLILNAANAPLMAQRRHLPAATKVAWFSRNLTELQDTSPIATVVEQQFCVNHTPVVPVAEVPICFGGSAVHNIDNVLAALLAVELTWSGQGDWAGALKQFRPSIADNPGRANVLDLNGAKIIVDFAHNPDGVRQIAQMVQHWPSKRRLITLGQAGDRSDDLLHELAVAALDCRPDIVILKESLHYLRGRQLGEVTGTLQKYLLDLGLRAGQIMRTDDETAAVEIAVKWAQPGDLLILLIHDDFASAIAQLQAAGAIESVEKAAQ